MQSPKVSELHEFVVKHVVQENTAALDVARLEQLEVALPPVSELLPDDIDQLATDSLQVWNQAVKQGEKDRAQQLHSLSTKAQKAHTLFLVFIMLNADTAHISQKCRCFDAFAMCPNGAPSKA